MTIATMRHARMHGLAVKSLVAFGAATTLALGTPSASFAQTWPTKPVRLLVPGTAGSAPDIVARILADKLSPKWAQSVVVENRAGAGGVAALSGFVRAGSDGYTLAFVPASMVTLTPHLFRDAQYDVDRDLLIAATAGISPMLIVANPAADIGSIADLVEKARASPGRVNVATVGVNSVPFFTVDMLNRRAGVQLFPVPFNNTTAGLTSTMAGDTVAMVGGLPPFVPQIKAGKLRAIAVTSKERLPGFESVPAATEVFAGLESFGWFAVFAPAGTSSAILERVNRDVNEVYRMPDVVTRLADLGIYPNPGTVADAQAFLAAQRALWKKVVDDAGLKPQ